MMLGRHARYMPVLNEKTLMGVISFYDVAKSVVDSQDFENRMLKAYIRDWPVESPSDLPSSSGDKAPVG
jgi:CBS domain-containing protein